MPKAQREIIRFEADKPVQITLNTNPQFSKSFIRKSDKWGDKTYYTLFTKDDKVFFASEALFNKLVQYQKGDTIVITLVDGKVWNVSSSDERKSSDISKSIDLASVMMRLDSIESQLIEVQKEVYGKEKTNEREYPQEETISF